MRDSVKHAKRLAAISQRLREIEKMEGDALTDEVRAESDALRDEAVEVRGRHTSALESEAAAEHRARAEFGTGGDGESAEFRALMGRTRPAAYFLSAAAGRPIADGPERELNEALSLPDDGLVRLPTRLLLRGAPVEHRADANTAAPSDVGREQHPIIGRVFVDSAASFCGVSMPAVATGDAAFTYIGDDDGIDSSTVAANTSVDATAVTFTPKTLSPTSHRARVRFPLESAARLAGMEEALLTDMRGQIMEGLDRVALQGNASPNIDGLFEETSTPSTDPSTVLSFGSAAAELGGRLDSRYAPNGLSDIRCLLGEATAGRLEGLFTSAGDESALERWQRRLGGVRMSPHVPDPVSSVALALFCKTSQGGNAVMPIWDSLVLVRDPYSDAASGQVSITGTALFSFAVIRSAAYDLRKVYIATA